MKRCFGTKFYDDEYGRAKDLVFGGMLVKLGYPHVMSHSYLRVLKTELTECSHHFTLKYSEVATFVLMLVAAVYTYKRKSCSQQGLEPFTTTVVVFTFWSFRVTYELFCAAARKRKYLR